MLKYFDKELKEQDKLKLLFPKNGSRYQSASCHKVTVKLFANRGKQPYYWYIDSKPANFNTISAQIKLGAGAHTITVLDSAGESITSNIWVYMPDCRNLKTLPIQIN